MSPARLSISLFSFLFLFQTCMSVQLDIKPNPFYERKTTQVTLTCRPDDFASSTHSVVSISIEDRRRNQNIATLRDQTIVNTGLYYAKHDVEGFLDKSSNDSYLLARINNPSADVAEEYECQIIYMDVFGKLVEKTAHNTIKMKSISVQLDIEPQTFYPGTTAVLTLTCRPDVYAPFTHTHSVVSVDILNKDRDTWLASMKEDTLVNSAVYHAKHDAEGFLDKSSNGTYLLVRINNPSADAAEEYECRIVYTDAFGDVIEKTARETANIKQ